MSSLDNYINDLVNGMEPQDEFPKNESSWEELFNLCKRLISAVVLLRNQLSKMEQERDRYKAALIFAKSKLIPIPSRSVDRVISQIDKELERE